MVLYPVWLHHSLETLQGAVPHGCLNMNAADVDIEIFFLHHVSNVIKCFWWLRMHLHGEERDE